MSENKKSMIYFLIGTKAQLIKMFPLMRELQAMQIPYKYIDTVQHGPICESIRRKLNIPHPDFFLTKPDTLIESTRKAVFWGMSILINAFSRRKTIFSEKGIVLVHGDTLSTLLGLIIGRICNQKVCHVEAGERTHKLLSPFPEEIIRRIVDRFSHLRLACGSQQMSNLQSEHISKNTIDLKYNTLIDAVKAVADQQTMQNTEALKNTILVSIHRYETITSKSRMVFLVDALETLSRSRNIVFGLHPPTRKKFEEFGLIHRLERISELQLRGLFDYPDFIQALQSCKFIITDGGGPQEESYFLGVPCMLLRSETERSHPNVFMPDWNISKVEWFNEHFKEFLGNPLSLDTSPSERAVLSILDYTRSNIH